MRTRLKLAEAKKLISLFPRYLIPVGSVIRNKKNPSDLDFVTLKPLDKVLKWFTLHTDIISINEYGDKLLHFIIDPYLKINIWKSTKEELPYMLFSYSYPGPFNLHIRKKAKNLGLTLSQYGLFDASNNLIKIKSFKDIFNILDIPFRTPAEEQLRETKFKDLPFNEAIKKIRSK